MGHGALALARACDHSGKKAEIYISGTATDPLIQKLSETKAGVHLFQPLPVATLHDLTKQNAGDNPVLPPGFNMPEFETALVQSLKSFDAKPYSEIWTTSVTGTLTRALKRAFEDKPFKTVSVVKSGDGDFFAPEKYHQPAKSPPPYPSCPYTDAKLWQFAVRHAAPNTLIWNTAG